MSSSSSNNPEVKETAILTWDVTDSKLNNYYAGSSYFNAPASKDQFQLYLFANQLFDINHIFARLYYNQNQTELPLQYRISILDANGHKQYTRGFTWNCYKSDYVYYNYNVSNYISRDKCNEYIVNGILKIYCEVDILKSKLQLPSNLLIKETATLTWCIDGFSSLTAVGHGHVNSPMFSKPRSKDKFALRLFPPNQAIFQIDHVIIRLHYNRNQTELPLQYRVSILDANGHKQYTREYTWNYSKSDYQHSCVNLTNYISYDKCNKLLVDGSLKIYCEVDVLKSIQPESSPGVNEDLETPDIIQDYQSILENFKYSDFVFVVGGKEFKVHKNILAARSEVFDAMFSNDLDEKNKNRVEIPDIDIEVFEHLLRYIYTGKVPEMNDYAADLFVASDKYQLKYLKSVCEQYLSTSLNVQTVAKVIILADMHQASELKEKCIQYITQHASEVKNTDGWKMLATKTDLMVELFFNSASKKYFM